MPRSSGGGSHRSGSHRSHHSSSHRSSGSHSGRITRRIHTSYFPGASRYVYYRGNNPHYVYSNYDFTKKESPLRFLILIFYIPFIIALFFMAKEAVRVPQKLSADYDTSIVINDDAGILDSTAALKSSLGEFYNKTGIAPALFTVNNEDWQGYYSDLESYAYDLYVNAFSDEKHWLIVYSQPKRPDPNFNDWYWEGMQGDYTVDIITESAADSFNGMMQRYLTNNSCSVEDAVKHSFDSITPGIMETSVNFEMLFMLLIFGGFVFFHAFFMVFYRPGAKYKDAKKCPENAQEQTCTYCGGIYIPGTCTECPHCGAGLSYEYQNM